MVEKLFSLVLAVAVLAVGGYVIARTFQHSKTVAPTLEHAMVAAVVRHEPGAAVMSTQCSSTNCTIYVRKGASRTCDGWLASLGANSGVSVVGIGKKSC